jgi:ABC-type nitrate/sulfonate/bicarbonate transport system substrate-binding protein
MSRTTFRFLKHREPLRVGFMPSGDCAPVIYAHEAGLFAKYNLEIELRREASCTAIIDKLVDGELDAAHAPCTLPFLAQFGLEAEACPCVSGMVLNLEGNAITISRRLWEEGVRDANTLREYIYRQWGRKTLTFGVLFLFSPQYFLLRQWLMSAGIKPETEVRILALPPSQMFPTLKLGYLDGYCASEPWPSLAVQAGAGFPLAASAQLAPKHPEKVLMVRHAFSLGRAADHERLLAALLESCAFCNQPQNWPQVATLLSRPEYVNAPAECLGASVSTNSGAAPESDVVRPALGVFYGPGVNGPTEGKTTWIMRNLNEVLHQISARAPRYEHAPVLQDIFRRDAFERAQELVRAHTLRGAGPPAMAQAVAGLSAG